MANFLKQLIYSTRDIKKSDAATSERYTGVGKSSSKTAPRRLSFASVAKNEYEVLRRARENMKRIAIETSGEDSQFKGMQREQLLGMIRSAFRCSPLPRALVLQRRLNIVGSVGGKLQLTTPDAEFNAAAAKYFKRWARSCEFTDGKCFNEVLQLIVSALDVGGDCVVVHDAWTPSGGILCGSNKIRVFESDEIGNLPESFFAEKFPGYVQRAGKIYDSFGRFVGVTVSTAERGKPIFAEDKAITLIRDPDAPAESCPWIYVQESWRVNQGRGVSTFAASVDLIGNYGDILSSEADAAKLNSTMFGAYKRTTEGDETGSALDDYTFDDAPTTDASASGEQPFAVGGSVAPSTPDGDPVDADTVAFPDHIARSRGVFFDVLPDGYEAQLYDTKRPNNQIGNFLLMMAGQVAATMGLNQTYATLEPQSSYTAFRGAQLLARPSFVAAQKMLERSICDWIATRLIVEAITLGLLPVPSWAVLPYDRTDFSLVWTWPRQEEVDAVNEQAALTARLKNGATTLRDEFGVDWRERVQQMAEEAAAMASVGLIHPATQTVSGQIKE